MSDLEPLGDVDPSWHKRPFRIILVRHGESQGNLDETVYCHVADSKVSLTPLGQLQAEEAGRKLRAICEKDGHDQWRVHFYVSPYKRTLQVQIRTRTRCRCLSDICSSRSPCSFFCPFSFLQFY